MAKRIPELDDLRVGDLREKAKEAGVTGTSRMRKDDLIEALDEVQSESVSDGKPTRAGGDVIDILIADHEKVKALFKQALQIEPGDADIEQLAMQITAELKLHTEAEETLFYPALKQNAIDSRGADAKNEVLQAYVEHGSVKQLIAQIESLDPLDESYIAILQVMSEQVAHHVEEEESEMFKEARRLLAKDELNDIGQRVLALKKSAISSAS